ncbi:MAG: hypothetical protein RLZZ426_400, partial [Actinomycetota bacterium]
VVTLHAVSGNDFIDARSADQGDS